MHADGLYLNDIGMTGCAIDGVESAPVSPVVGAGMAFEAFHVAVRSDGDVGNVVVAVDAGLRLFCRDHPGGEEETGNNDGE